MKGVGKAAATTLPLVVPKLATNSLNYGALQIQTGTLDAYCSLPGVRGGRRVDGEGWVGRIREDRSKWVWKQGSRARRDASAQ